MRINKVWITIILICCSIFFFSACAEDRIATSISINGYLAENPLEFTIGDFSFSDYTVSVTYEDGETENIALADTMISETDKLKFYQEGRNTITVTYKGAETSVEINVLRNKFPENVKLKELNTTYTGKTFTVEVVGDIPGGTKILYPQGNTFKNAGEYDMTAILQCDGYESKILSSRVVIKKATYDVSNAQLYEGRVVFNNDWHSLTIKGKKIEVNGATVHNPASLPQGVSVSYSITKVKDGNGVDIPTDKQQVANGNMAIDAGVYKVCAYYKGDESNYESIEPSVEYLTIERDTYDLSNVVFINKTVTYSGKENSLSILDENKLPFDVSVSYQIKKTHNGAGEEIQPEDTYKKGNIATDTGVYLVKAIFSINGKNAENYTPDPLEMEATLTIQRASYDEEMSDLYINSEYYVFDQNKTYEISFDCELPKGVTPEFKVTNAKGEVIVGETLNEFDETLIKTTYKYLFNVEEPGEYTCLVTFKHNNEHYKEIAVTLTAWVIISNVGNI